MIDYYICVGFFSQSGLYPFFIKRKSQRKTGTRIHGLVDNPMITGEIPKTNEQQEHMRFGGVLDLHH
jgi:hypothetical protein